MSDLYDRISRTLGSSLTKVRALPLQTLRDLVQPVNPHLAEEIDLVLQSGAYSKPIAEPAKKKVAKDIEAAVHAVQLYIGRGGLRRVTDDQKLYRNMNRKIAAVAKRRNMDEADVHQQITDEAKRRGGIQALPGKDL